MKIIFVQTDINNKTSNLVGNYKQKIMFFNKNLELKTM